MKARMGIGLALLSSALVASCDEGVGVPARSATLESAHREAPRVDVAFSQSSAERPLPKRSSVRGVCDPSAPKKFTLIHLNDLQARYTELVDGKSRYAYIAGYLKSQILQDPNTLVLDAGDDYEKGALAELRSMGEATRRMIQVLPIDVRTIGNHDFSYGREAVLKDANESQHPVLAANITTRDIENPFLPYTSFQVGCVKVGVVGVVTGNYGADDEPTKEPFDEVFLHNPRYSEVIAQQVKEHRGEVDVMIALTHIGIYADRKVAMKVPGIDFVIGGHTEDLLKEPQKITKGDGSRTWVMQAGHYGRAIGNAEITVSDRGVSIEKYRMITVDGSLPADDAVDAYTKKVTDDFAPDTHRTIGTIEKEIGKGPALADLTWRAVKETYGVDGMIIGYDVFWAPLAAGELTLQRLYDAVPVQREPAGTSGFSSLGVIQLKGDALMALRARLRYDRYAMMTPPAIDRSRTYTIAIEKRAHFAPTYAFYGSPNLPAFAEMGELIDPLEAYVRKHTALGKAVN